MNIEKQYLRKILCENEAIHEDEDHIADLQEIVHEAIVRWLLNHKDLAFIDANGNVTAHDFDGTSYRINNNRAAGRIQFVMWRNVLFALLDVMQDLLKDTNLSQEEQEKIMQQLNQSVEELARMHTHTRNQRRQQIAQANGHNHSVTGRNNGELQ